MNPTSQTTPDRTRDGRYDTLHADRIAEAVITLLTDPATPADLRDSVDEAMLDLCTKTRATWHHPDVLRVQIPIIVREEERAAEDSESHDPANRPVEGNGSVGVFDDAPIQPDDIARLTEAVIVILNNPATPCELHDAVADTVLRLTDRVNRMYANPDVLRIQLPIALRQAQREGGDSA